MTTWCMCKIVAVPGKYAAIMSVILTGRRKYFDALCVHNSIVLNHCFHLLYKLLPYLLSKTLTCSMAFDFTVESLEVLYCGIQ